MVVGNSGIGIVTIEPGDSEGRVLSTSSTVGAAGTGNGTVEVKGSGAEWEIEGNLAVGGGGTGTVTISDSGTVTSGTGSVGTSGTGHITVDGEGSLWQVTGDIDLGGQGSGTIETRNPGTVKADTVHHKSGGRIIGDGTIDATIIESQNNGAGILPGFGENSIATLTFDADWDATGGVTLSIEIGGAEDYDVLAVTGDVFLGGVLNVTLQGYNPVDGDTFHVVTVGGVLTGTFAMLNLPTLDPGLSWQVIYGSNVTLKVVDNWPPVAQDDQYWVLHDRVLQVSAPGVLANDQDPDMDPLTAVLVDDVSHGVLTLNPDGSFIYEPDPGFAGTDWFTYHANDGLENSNLATVTINVTNQAPVAQDDQYGVIHDRVLPVTAPGVLSNDFDSDMDPLTAVLVDDVSNGSLALNPDGSFTYEPDAAFVGIDWFTYYANDGVTNSNLATVTIHVTNQAPVAQDDHFSVMAEGTLNAPAPGVLENDFDADMDPLTAVLVGDVSNGSLTLNPDGSFTYTPDSGFSGTDSFTYYANDGVVNSNLATVTINVYGMFGFAASDPVFDDALSSEDAGAVSNSGLGWALGPEHSDGTPRILLVLEDLPGAGGTPGGGQGLWRAASPALLQQLGLLDAPPDDADVQMPADDSVTDELGALMDLLLERPRLHERVRQDWLRLVGSNEDAFASALRLPLHE